MNVNKIKAAFRQVQEDCRKREGACTGADKLPCKYKEICTCIYLSLPGQPKLWRLK